MAVGYKEAFGLTDNPFGPLRRVGALPPNLTASLEKQPLLLHRNGDLESLYCEKISSFQTACDNLATLLEAAGYAVDSPDSGVASFLVAVEGDRGAGKTTLACRMLQLMRNRYPKGQPAPEVEEVLLQSLTETVTDQINKMKSLEANDGGAKAEYRCILIDDLLADAYPYTVQLYDLLRRDAAIFMVFTSYDPKMGEQIAKSLHTVQRYSVAPLTPDDAIAYINARYQIFRIPALNGLNAEPLFPFDEKDIRTAVSISVVADATGPVNLRLIASTLNDALTQKLQAIARQNPGFDVNAIASGELAALKIKLAQSYEIVVRT